jgi:hypothetical protein
MLRHDPEPSLEVGRDLSEVLVTSVLAAIVLTLERRPDLAARLWNVLGAVAVPLPSRASEHMSVGEYAAYTRVSERTVRYQLKEMVEGVHYQRAGRKGRRVVICVAEADRWHAERVHAHSAAGSVEELAIDEVTRRRAQVALRKRKENK